MKIYESGWIDLKKTIEYITRGTICNTMENFENFVQEGLQNGFPQLYRYIYKDYRGNTPPGQAGEHENYGKNGLRYGSHVYDGFL